MPYYGSEEAFRHYRPRVQHEADDSRYLELMDRGTERSLGTIREVGRDAAEHAREMGRIYGELPQKLVGGYMMGRDFANNQAAARRQEEEHQRQGQRFAEEQALAPIRRTQMEEAIAAQKAARGFSEEQLAAQKAENAIYNKEVAPGITFREKQITDKADLDRKVALAQLNAAGMSQQESASNKRMAAAKGAIMTELQTNRAINPNNPTAILAVSQQIAAKHKLTPEEAAIALADARQAVASGAASANIMEQQSPEFWRHRNAIESVDSRLAQVQALNEQFQSYLAEQGQLGADPTKWQDTERANEARTQFASYLEASGKGELANSIRHASLGREMVDTRMKKAILDELQGVEAQLAVDQRRLGPKYGNSPELMNLRRTIEDLKADIAGKQTGAGRFFGTSPAGNNVKGAPLPAAAPPQTPGQRFMTPRSPTPPPGGAPVQQAPYTPGPTLRPKQVPVPKTAANAKVGGGA